MPRIEDVIRPRAEECGIYPGLTRDGYDAIEALNCSSIKPGIDIRGKSYTANARRIRWAYETGGDACRTTAQQDRLDFGVALHMAVLEPERFATDVVYWPKRRAGKAWDEFCEDHSGQLILRVEDYERIGRVLSAVLALPEWQLVAPYLDGADRECAIVTNEDGIQKKGLVDVVSHSCRALVDLKTTAVESTDAFDRLYWELGYWISMGSYLEWYNREADAAVDQCVLFVLVVKEPYDLIVRPLDRMDLEFGHAVQLAACKTVKDAVTRNYWPGSGGGQTLPCILPSYAVPEGSHEFQT